jgi:nuclear GTP-binding protein
MILNDWLRGKIPYYTTPPEDLMALPPKADKTLTTVEQIFSKIPISSKFLPEDMKSQQVESDVVSAAATEKAADVSAKASVLAKSSEKSNTVQLVTDWDEVFASVVGEDVKPTSDHGNESEADEADETTLQETALLEKDVNEDTDDDSFEDVDDDDDEEEEEVSILKLANSKKGSLAKNGKKRLMGPPKFNVQKISKEGLYFYSFSFAEYVLILFFLYRCFR